MIATTCFLFFPNTLDGSRNCVLRVPGNIEPTCILEEQPLPPLEVAVDDVLRHVLARLVRPRVAEPTVFESNMMRFRVDPSLVHPRFLVQVLQTRELKSQIHSRAKRAVNQASINQQDVGSFRVPVPPLSKQLEFVARVASIENVAACAKRSAVALDSLFASLQHRAFRGELGLAETEIEMSSK